jgi:hypothetical protein
VTTEVRIRCEHRYSEDEQCSAWSEFEHVHQPTPCENGKDERHHQYTVPSSVTLRIGGQLKRVRFHTVEQVPT